MRTQFLSLLVLLILVACSPPSQLATDTNEVIDLSGRWNATDSQIAVSELIDKLAKSSWYKSLPNSEGGVKHFHLKPVDTEAGEGTLDNYESIMESLEASFAQLINLKVRQKGEVNYQYDYFIEPLIGKSESKSVKESVYFYTLSVSIFDAGGEVVWQEKETTKKYIKN